MQPIFVAAVAVEAHGSFVVGSRNEDGEAVAPQNALDGVLPFFVGNLEHCAEKDDFFTGKPKFGAQ